MSKSTVIDQAAAEFGRHTKSGEGWALALAVAACCLKGTGNGRPSRNLPDRGGFKVSLVEFARRAGTSDTRVARYLTTWEKAAAARLVPPADKLTPNDWNNVDLIPIDVSWSRFYDAGDASKGSRATPLSIGRQMADDPQLAQAAAKALADGAIELVGGDTLRGLSEAVDEKILSDTGADPDPDRLSDRGKSSEEKKQAAYWNKVDKALHLLLDAKVRIANGATPPAHIAILMELLTPEQDWDEALRQEIGRQL